MLKKYSYKSIISFILITSTILMPLSFLPKKVEAQYNLAGYTSGLAPAIARLPQCQQELGNGIKKLFNGIGDLFSGTGGDGDGVTVNNLPTKGLSMGSVSSLSTISNIPVDPLPSLDTKASSATYQAAVPAFSDKEVSEQLKKVNTNLKEVLGDTEAINANSSCIQSIGRLIAKMLLQKLTKSTVDWINSGFDGSPSFIQDPKKFFKNIADTEILQFGIEIQDSPFGKEWLRNQALAYKTKFADNARYSLDELIQQTNPDYSAATFQTDFSMGGWDAWTAMTQVPANNPLGAKLMFDNEIQKRLAGTSQSTAQQVHEALSQANGFLGDQRCISPGTGQINYDVTYSEYQEGLKQTPPIELCSGFKYVTPGKMISDAATNAMGYPNNAILNIQDLNDAVAAVLDATLNQFSSDLYAKGFANINTQGMDGTLVFSGTNNGPYKTQTEKDYIPSQLSSSWLQANPDFNIRTDLTQALIDEQRTYADKLALQNKELNSTTDGKEYNIGVCPDGWTGKYPDCIAPIVFDFSIVGNPYITNKTCPSGFTGTYPFCKGIGTYNGGASNAYGLMPAIYQLDYCIPGPHPGWENDSRETLNNISIPEKEASPDKTTSTVNSVVGMGISTGASLLIPGIGSIVGPVLGSIFGAITGADEQKDLSRSIRSYYTGKFYDLTGFSFQSPWGEYQSTAAKHVNMMSSEGLSFVLNRVLDRYINIMKKTYFSSPDMLPTIAKDAVKEFYQLPGYNQMIKDNKEKILEIKTTVSILGEIKDAVDKLNTEYPDGGDEYESQLKTQINAFGRLSASMVNGDDISAADDLAKQIVLKKDYIYKNLLKGPYGCEAFLENQANIKPFPSAGPGVMQASNDWNNYNINSVKRMTYPFPIIYDYNNLTKGETIPDPWTDCNVKNPPESCNNKMPDNNQYDKYGPGFLSFVRFTSTFGTLNTQLYNGDERLRLGDLIYDHDPCGESGNTCDIVNRTLGKSKWNEGRDAKVFETTIGIY